MTEMSRGKRIAGRILFWILSLAAALCFLAVPRLSRLLPAQFAAERWAGEGETAFAQLSCYLPVNEPLSQGQIYTFRYAILDQLQKSGLETDTSTRLFRDAWCAFGKLKASSSRASGDVSVIAVGGDYFSFHPLRLLNGSYLSEDDLMKDRILLDEETAWLLFGGTDLAGMEVKLNGFPFVVSGVVEREKDFASQKAYSAGRGIYMAYDTYTMMVEGTGATCYELVMAEPVQGLSLGFAQEKFPIGQGEIVENSGRFSYARLMGLLKQFGERSMQRLAVSYPYWENAARCVEDWCALLLLLGHLCLLFPVLRLLKGLFRILKRGKEKLSEDLLPDVRDKAEESLRKKQRKRWEKKHPGED